MWKPFGTWLYRRNCIGEAEVPGCTPFYERQEKNLTQVGLRSSVGGALDFGRLVYFFYFFLFYLFIYLFIFFFFLGGGGGGGDLGTQLLGFGVEAAIADANIPIGLRKNAHSFRFFFLEYFIF